MESVALFLASGRNEGWDGPWWIFPPLFFLAWIAVIALVAWFFSRRRWCRGGGDDGGFSAANGVLAERFARGDISNEEYSERLGQLRNAFADTGNNRKDRKR